MATSDVLRAGAAMLDITPKAGAHLGGSGMGEYRPAQSVLDPLYAKALVFESNGRKLCLLALDVIIITDDYAAQIRKAAADRFGFDPDAVMVHAIQSHSAPGMGSFMLDPDFPLALPPELEYLRGCETPYCQYATERGIEAIGMAANALQLVQTGAASAVSDKFAFNRRGVMRDGSIGMPWPVGRAKQPLGPTNLRYMEGPIDPEIGVFCARDEKMRMVAMVLHHSCHPVNVFGTRSSYHAVSADWPGAWSAGMQDAYGPACVPLVLNGCCGNINPWDPFDPEFVPDHLRMGNGLAEIARKAVPTVTFSGNATLDWRVRRIALQYREVPKERQAEVDRVLAESPQPKWLKDDPNRVDPGWFHAASTKSIEYCRKRMPEFLYEVQVLRVGDTAFVGLPGEPFVEGQLQIKLKSPAKPTYVAHMTTQYVGYIPTREACLRGGHEANVQCTYWAKLAPDSLDRIVEAAGQVLGEVWGENA
jgi:hypothetical protein